VERSSRTPALAYSSITPNHERNIAAEIAAAIAAGSDLDHVDKTPKDDLLDLDEDDEMVTPTTGSPTKQLEVDLDNLNLEEDLLSDD